METISVGASKRDLSVRQTQDAGRAGRLRSTLSFDLFGLTDDEAKRRRFLILRMAVVSGVAVMIALALIPASLRTPWGDFLIAAGAFLVAQLVTEMGLSWRRSQVRRAATRGLLAAAVVGGIAAAVVVPSGEQETASADTGDDIAEFIEEEVLDKLAIGGAVAAGASAGNSACGSRCATAGAVVGAGVGIAITNTKATVQAAKDTAKSVSKAAKAAGKALTSQPKQPKKVVQRDAAASTPNLPKGTSATPDNSSPQPTCQAGYGRHGRSTCSLELAFNPAWF